MAWQFGSYVVPIYDEPFHDQAGEMGEVSQRRVSKMDTVNGAVTIVTSLGRSSPEFTLNLYCGDTTKVQLQALYEAEAPFIMKTPWDAVGYSIEFLEFHPKVKRGNPLPPDMQWELEIMCIRR